MKMFCGLYKQKKPAALPKKTEAEPEKPFSSRMASTVITQKSSKPLVDLMKLECFRNNDKILQNYEIIEKIGGGSFGEIYKVKSLQSDQIFAMKIEKKRPEKNLLLIKERQILNEFQQDYGFPHINSFIKGDNFSYLVMSYLGENLESLKKKMNNKFSLKTVMMVGYQLMERIEILHTKNFLHRDIKPENFVIGSGENYKTIYIIDFGLSKAYIENDEHIPFKDHKGMVGTARYASIKTHLGIEQSRRDDLEAIGYMLVYFAKGRLPWQNIFAKNKEQKYLQIMNSKQKVTVETLCCGLPKEFVSYFDYVKALEFTSKPDYKYLKQLFLTMMKNDQHCLDYEFDWLELFNRNSNSNSSLEMKDDENYHNHVNDYLKHHKNANNIDLFNENRKPLQFSPKPLKNAKLPLPANFDEKMLSYLTSSNEELHECDLKEDDYDQVKIQETYNTMRPKLIRSSIKKMKNSGEVFLVNFRGNKHFFKFNKKNLIMKKKFLRYQPEISGIFR